MSEARSPSPRPKTCPHDVACVIVTDDEGWSVPTRGDCSLCPEGWTDARFKVGGPKVQRDAAAKPFLVECPKPGCVVITEEGVAHETPCLFDFDYNWAPPLLELPSRPPGIAKRPKGRRR